MNQVSTGITSVARLFWPLGEVVEIWLQAIEISKKLRTALVLVLAGLIPASNWLISRTNFYLSRSYQSRSGH